MTFRSRLVLAAIVAVAIAVVAAAIVAYFPARNALIKSLDNELQYRTESALNSTHPIVATDLFGDYARFWPSGIQASGVTLPITNQVRAVAAGVSPPFFTSVEVNGVELREYVTVAPAGTEISTNSGIRALPTNNSFQLATPLTSVNQQIRQLRLFLILVALGGIALAVLLGWLVGRTALVPLNDLTATVEDVADTTDVSRRLDPGGPDELGRLRRAFNRLLGALEVSREAQRLLVLDASHELRTPLTSLRTNLEVLRRVDELDPIDREVLITDVLSQLEELTNLVGDLAELARGDQRPQEPALLRFDLLVEDAVAVATTHGRSRGVRFELSARPTWVNGQRDRITRAVGNLLDNALKWSPDGEVVEVTANAGTVTVRDHGPGIAPDDLPHIFDRFYRAPNARGLPGSGLGLAIVAQVAEAEGGSVDVGTAPGGGAVLRLQLPIATPPTFELDPVDGLDEGFDDHDGDPGGAAAPPANGALDQGAGLAQDPDGPGPATDHGLPPV